MAWLMPANVIAAWRIAAKFAVRVEDLRRSLLDHSPRIVHFAGHSDGTNGIFTENDQGKAYQVPNDALAGGDDLPGLAKRFDHRSVRVCYQDRVGRLILGDPRISFGGGELRLGGI